MTWAEAKARAEAWYDREQQQGPTALSHRRAEMERMANFARRLQAAVDEAREWR